MTYYSGSLHIDHTRGAGWYGIQGIADLKLSPGDYWIIFKPAKQIDRILEMPKNPPSPIEDYAVSVEMTGDKA